MSNKTKTKPKKNQSNKNKTNKSQTQKRAIKPKPAKSQSKNATRATKKKVQSTNHLKQTKRTKKSNSRKINSLKIVRKRQTESKKWEEINPKHIVAIVSQWYSYRRAYKNDNLSKKNPNYDDFAKIRNSLTPKNNVANEYIEPIPISKDFLRTLESLRTKEDKHDKEVNEFAFGLSVAGEKVAAELHEGDNGSVLAIPGFHELQGHTHPDNSPKKEAELLNYFQQTHILPNLKFKEKSHAEAKKELDERVTFSFLDTPSLQDAYTTRWRQNAKMHQEAPELIIAPHHNIAIYPDAKIPFNEKAETVKFDKMFKEKLGEIAIADAIIRSGVPSAKSLPDYQQKVEKFEKIYHKNIDNVFSNVNVNVEYMDKEKTKVKQKPFHLV